MRSDKFNILGALLIGYIIMVAVMLIGVWIE